jgi:uncharacterized repeat protein (TIGR01451 family)
VGNKILKKHTQLKGGIGKKMNKGVSRALKLVLTFLLVFTTFAPSLALATGTNLTWGIEHPEGYNAAQGQIRIINESTKEVSYGSINGDQVSFPNVTVAPSNTYGIEVVLNFFAFDQGEELAYYDHRTVSGAELEQLSMLSIPENAKEISLHQENIPIQAYSINVQSQYLELNSNPNNGAYIQKSATKLLTEEEMVSFSIIGRDEDHQGYFLQTSIQTATTDELDFAQSFMQAVPFEFQGDARLGHLQLTHKPTFSNWNGFESGQTKWYVTPGSYDINVQSELEIPGGSFFAHWHKENVEILSEMAIPMPGLPDEIKKKSMNWNNNDGYIHVDVYSQGYRLLFDINDHPLTSMLEIKDEAGTTKHNENYNYLNRDMYFNYPEDFSGKGDIIVSVKNSDEVLATNSFPFEFEEQRDPSIRGVVVTAEDEKGIPLLSGSVTVMERVDPDTYDANYGKNTYELTEVYRTTFKDVDGISEAFIPNAYLLAGREYEIVVDAFTSQGERIIYHKSVKSGEVTTIHFTADRLTELEIQTEKQFHEGQIGLTAIDTENKQVATYPYMIHPNQKMYIQSDYDLLLNAQIVNTQEDVGYYYSEWIELGQSPQQTIQLDSLDENMTKMEAPSGYEDAKIGVDSLFDSNQQASTFFISNPLRDLEFGNNLNLSLSITSQGYLYQFDKYIYDKNAPLNIDITGEFTGWLSQGGMNPQTTVNFYTYYTNDNSVELTYVGRPYNINQDQVQFTVINENGQKKQMSTSKTDGFAETNTVSTTNNLLNYQIYKDEVPVGDIISANEVWKFRAALPAEPGVYRLKLEEQLFPTDVATLQLDREFHVSQGNQESTVKTFRIGYSDPTYSLMDSGNVRIMEIRKQEDGSSYIYNRLSAYRNYYTNQYEIYSPIYPDADYFFMFEGQISKDYKYHSLIHHKKMKGSDILALSDYVIDRDALVSLSLSNETQTVKEDVRYRVIVPIEDDLSEQLSLSGTGTKLEAFVTPGEYTPILQGVNDVDAYSFIYPKKVVNKSEIIRLTDLPTVEINLKQNNVEIPFKSFGVLYGNSAYYNEMRDKRVLRKLHITPGITSLYFNVVKLEENETPWKYDLTTNRREFNSNTTVNLAEEFTPSIKYFENWKSTDGINVIFSSFTLNMGDVYLNRVAVGKEPENRIYSMTPNETPPIRDYDGEFTNFQFLNPTIKIMDDKNKVVYRAKYSSTNLGYFYVEKELAPGKYTLEYQIPIGPNKTGGFTRTFDILGDNSPFVTLQSPANNSISNNRNVTVTGNSNANASVNVKIYNHGTETVVSEKSVTADDNGHFTASFALSADGKYDVYGYTAEVHSNLVTFTVDTTPPAKPENVQIEQISNTLKVTWNAVSDAQSYKVEMATGTGAFQTLQESNTTNQYTLTAIQPGTTYKFRITAKDAVGNLSTASDIASFETSTFVVTKLDVLGEASSFNLYKVGQELQLQLEGSYQAGYAAKAMVTYETDAENTSEVNLTYNEATKKYEGTFTITEGMTKLTKIEGWIINDQAENTDKLTTTVNKTVGATFKGQVTEAGADLTGKARVRLVGATSISIDTDENGHFNGEGIPAGDYTVNVVYPLIGGKTFYNVTNGKVTLANGQKTQLAASISLPAYRDIKLTFVEKGTTTTVKNNLHVQITNNSGYAAYGYINENGEFITWGNVTTLKGLQTGDYQVQVYRQGLYKDTTQNITILPNQDYVTNPFVIEVDKITEDVVDITLLFSGNITDVDSVNLYSWKAYEAFGYSDAGYYYVSRPEITDGKLVLRDVVYSDDYQLVINKQGYRQFIMSPIIIDETSENLQVFMDQGLTITGKITNNNGEEVPAAQVYAYSNSSYGSVTAGQDGSYELKGLASDEDMTIQVTAPNHVTYQHTYKYNEVGTPLDIVLNKATFVHGKVVDKNNKPLKYVYINAYSALVNPAPGSKELGQYKGWARTGSDGYFKITGLEDGEYDLYISDYNYPSKVERGVATETDGLVFMLQEEGEGSFVGTGNNLTASKQSVVPGKTIQYRLNYQNNGTADVENIPLKVNLPANVEIIPQSVQLNGKDVAWNNGSVTVAKVAKGEKGSLTFEVTVKDGSEAVVQTTATINDTVEQPAEVLSAVTSVLFVTIHAPATTAEKKIKVYGNAKTGSNVEVYANGSLLSKVKVDGRWWFAEVTLPVTAATEEESFTLVAKVLDGTESVTSEPVVVDYSPSIPQIKDLTVYAGWNGNVKINPYTGLATFAIVEKTPLDTTVVFNEEIDSASVTFLGETYNMTSTDKKTFTFDGRRLGDWSSYGEQLLELTYKKGDITITFPIMEIIVLIDPSGFVFEGSMDAPLAGVTAVVEQKVNNQWVRWNAEFFGQINPQVTDENGRYGWDVIQGEWRVVFTKDGYDPYISRIVTVPPPETQLNVPMVRNTEPVVDSITPAANSTSVEVNANMTVTFDRLMSTVDKDQSIKLYKINGDNRTEVQGAVLATEVNGYKETGNATGFFEADTTKKLAKTFTFDPAANLEAGVTYELEINENFADYAGKLLGDTVKQRFTTKQATNTPPPTGGGVATPAPSTLEVVNGVLTVDEKWLDTKDTKGTVKEDAVLAAIAKSAVFDKLELKGSAVTDFAFSTKLVKAIIEKNSKATVVVENNLGSFTLPVSALTGNLGSDSLQVVITVKKSVRSFLEKGVTVLSSPVEFNVTVTGNGKTEQINRFSSFVERTINLTGEANVTRATAVKLNENVYVTAPTLFAGKTAVIKSQNLGTYIIVQAGRSYSDVDNGKNWAEKYIETLASKGIIKGKSETEYGADDQMTRAQFAMLISRSLGLTASGEYKGKFKDITTEQATNEMAEVIAAYEAGIIQGKADGNFAPNATITRAEAAAMLARAMKVVGYDAKKLDVTKKISSFKDAKSIGAWAAADVELMVQAGIINGMSDNTMKPNAPTKRDQMAKMLADFLVFVGLMNK